MTNLTEGVEFPSEILSSDKLGKLPERFKALYRPHRALRDFEALFQAWRSEGQNWELLEAGATPDLKPLAKRCFEWAHSLSADGERRTT